MLFALPFPAIDPVALSLGPIAIRWYALAYLVGLVGGAWYVGRLFAVPGSWPRGTPPFPPARVWDLMGVIALGVIVGGRLGYVLFYAPAYFAAHPFEILALWQGGMSFHGGCVGATLAAAIHTRLCRGSILGVSDALGCVAPIGLFFGRLANFINGELWGRPSDLPWAVLFPGGGPPRHPSQLYEAMLEGVVLFLLVNGFARYGRGLRHPGFCTGLFLIGYAVFRIGVEFFREPDAGLGILFELGGAGVTMGILLSAPMLVGGLGLVVWSRCRKTA